MHSVNFKGKPNPKNPDLVKIEMILFKTGYARSPKVIDITGYYKDWDQPNQRFRDVSSETVSTNKQLLDLKMNYLKVVEEWESESLDWTPIQWSHCFEKERKTKQKIKNLSVHQFIVRLEEHFKTSERVKNGKVITSSSNSELYLSLRNSLTLFTRKSYGRNFQTFYFEEIDEQFFKDYALFLQKRGLENGNKGGIVNKLKSLRSTINYAYKAKMQGVNPNAAQCVQDKMKAGTFKPKTIPYEYLQKIENLDVTKYTKKQRLHIDVFLFSFYTGGMCNVDVVNLTHSSFNNGMIIYERAKTPKEAKMPVLNKAVEIIKKYEGLYYSDYVLPILNKKHTTEKKIGNRVTGFTESVNKTLRLVSKDIKYNEKITWNSARGTYITKMINAKIAPEIVAEHAGNSPAIIYKHYYNAIQSEEIVDKLNSVLG